MSMLKKVDELFNKHEDSEKPRYLVMNPYGYAELVSEVADGDIDKMYDDLHHYKGMIIAVTTDPDFPEMDLI